MPQSKRLPPRAALPPNEPPFPGWTPQWDRMEEEMALSEVTLNRKC